jgi:hypothetical protein
MSNERVRRFAEFIGMLLLVSSFAYALSMLINT